MLKIVCVQVQDYLGRGKEYVLKLRDAVARNVTRPYQFVCVTDEQIDGVDCITPPPLKGWLTKIWLFEAFKEGPVLFLDLDTFVMNSLEPLLDALKGVPAACLRNFYHEHTGASGVLYWEADLSDIWRDYNAAGRPEIATDEEWIIPRLPGRTCFVQDELPGRVLSFKGHCNAVAPPADAVLICFHGKPRPHEVGGWVAKIWDGAEVPDEKALHDLLIVVTTNTSPAQIEANLETACVHPAPFLDVRPAIDRELWICASGPSLKEHWEKIPRDADILALNGAYRFLVENGRTPEYFAMIDARALNVNFLTNPQNKTEFLLSLQCHPSVYGCVVGKNISKFGLASPSCLAAMQKHGLNEKAFGGGATIGLTALALAPALGYRRVVVTGYESSFPDGQRRVWEQPQNVGEILIDVWVEDRKYITTPALAAQVRDFRGLLAAVTEMFPGFELDLMSGGLLRDFLITGQQEPANKKTGE